MTFDIVIIGYVAGFCTAVAQFPQAVKVISVKNITVFILCFIFILDMVANDPVLLTAGI